MTHHAEWPFQKNVYYVELLDSSYQSLNVFITLIVQLIKVEVILITLYAAGPLNL